LILYQSLSTSSNIFFIQSTPRSPFSILAIARRFRDQSVIQELRVNPEDVYYFSQILKLFKSGVLLLSDVDLLLHPLKSELNWTIGIKNLSVQDGNGSLMGDPAALDQRYRLCAWRLRTAGNLTCEIVDLSACKDISSRKAAHGSSNWTQQDQQKVEFTWIKIHATLKPVPSSEIHRARISPELIKWCCLSRMK